MAPARDILIVGGGFTGASLACALADGRRRVRVLEARSEPANRFAGELIHPTGVDVLERLDLLRGLRAAGAADVYGFAVTGAPGRAPQLLPYAEIPLGRPAGLAIDHHELVRVLRETAASRRGVTVERGCRVTDLLHEGGRVCGVRTEAGEAIRADLTLIAEGRHSRLRRRLGIAEQQRLLSYNAALLVDEAELPHGPVGHIFLGAPGPVLAYPIATRGERHRVRMCFDIPSLPEDGPGTGRIAAALRDRWLPFVPAPLHDAASAALREGALQVAAVHAISTERCVAPGVALVGESGGCSHPLTAAGMTICLHDVRVLAEELAGGGAEHEQLARYQARRYRFARAREVLTDALYEVFLADGEGTRTIREGIFDYWQSGPRARAASLALLSGADSRLQSFLVEYWRVAGHGLRRSVRGEVPGLPPTLAGRARGLRGLVGKSVEKLGRVVTHAREGTLR